MRHYLQGTYNAAGLFFIISGLLHLPLFLWAGTSPFAIQMAITGLIWIMIGFGLRWRIPLLPYLAFLLMLVGLVYVFVVLGFGPVPSWWWLLIGAADLLAALCLFRLIWAKRRR